MTKLKILSRIPGFDGMILECETDGESPCAAKRCAYIKRTDPHSPLMCLFTPQELLCYAVTFDRENDSKQHESELVHRRELKTEWYNITSYKGVSIVLYSQATAIFLDAINFTEMFTVTFPNPTYSLVVPANLKTDKSFVFLTLSTTTEGSALTWWFGPEAKKIVQFATAKLNVASSGQYTLIRFNDSTYHLYNTFTAKPIQENIPMNASEFTIVDDMAVFGQPKNVRWLSLVNGRQISLLGVGSRTIIRIVALDKHTGIFYHCPSRGFCFCIYTPNGRAPPKLLCETVLPVDRNDCGDKIEFTAARSFGFAEEDQFIACYALNRFTICNTDGLLWSKNSYQYLPPYGQKFTRLIFYALFHRRRLVTEDNFQHIMEFMMWKGMPEEASEWARPFLKEKVLNMTFARISNLHWVSGADLSPLTTVDVPGRYTSKEYLNTEGPIQFIITYTGTIELGVTETSSGKTVLTSMKDCGVHSVTVLVCLHWSKGLIYVTDVHNKILWTGHLPPVQEKTIFACCQIGYSSSCTLDQTLLQSPSDTMPCSCGKVGQHIVDPTGDCYCMCGRFGAHIMQYITEPKCGPRGSCICGNSKKHVETNVCQCLCGRKGIHVLTKACAPPVEACICGETAYHQSRPICECQCGIKGIHGLLKSTCRRIHWTDSTHYSRTWPSAFTRVVTTTLHCWIAKQLPADTAVTILEFFPWHNIDSELKPPFFGRCACNNVILIAKTEPKNSFYDHHRLFQKLYGAPFVLHHVFSGLEFHEGESNTADIPWHLYGSKGKQCTRCHMILYLSDPSGLVYTTPSIFNFRSHEMPNSFKPKRHLNFSHRVLDVVDSLPRHDGNTFTIPKIEDGLMKCGGLLGACPCTSCLLRIRSEIRSSTIFMRAREEIIVGSPVAWFLVTSYNNFEFIFRDPSVNVQVVAGKRKKFTCSNCGALMALTGHNPKTIFIPRVLFGETSLLDPSVLVLDDKSPATPIQTKVINLKECRYFAKGARQEAGGNKAESDIRPFTVTTHKKVFPTKYAAPVPVQEEEEWDEEEGDEEEWDDEENDEEEEGEESF
eukprot:PhF_6_TR41319/c0_g3_i1/m.62605